MVNDDFWCFSWHEVLPASEGKDKAAMVKAARWQSGSVIPICFLDGDQALHDRVKDTARRWVGKEMANLKLSFQQKKNAAVRISFQFRGAWSSVGTTCLNITDTKRPTMNLGGVNALTPIEEFDRVVLHEFGHALGLIHEHQSPGVEIVWKRKQVIEDLTTAPYFWSEDQIEKNLFTPAAKNECEYSKFDDKSIMLYPIPRKWTNNGFSSRLNPTLSETDIQFIRRRYPHG